MTLPTTGELGLIVFILLLVLVSGKIPAIGGALERGVRRLRGEPEPVEPDKDGSDES